VIAENGDTALFGKTKPESASPGCSSSHFAAQPWLFGLTRWITRRVLAPNR